MDNREAVARALYKFGCENVVGGEDCPFEEQDPETYEITIGLADAAISAMGQAQVKDLVWRDIAGGWGSDNFCLMPVAGTSRYRLYGLEGPFDGAQEYGSKDEAFVAAQLMHETHILSALSPAPVSGEGGEHHDSDCARHNPPAYEAGPCDCTLSLKKGQIDGLETYPGMDAAKAALSPAPVSGWRPIESAPKDGTKVDLWCHRKHCHGAEDQVRKCNASWGLMADQFSGVEFAGWRGISETYSELKPLLWCAIDLPTPPEDAS